jgi:hypothetical protein
MSDFSRNFFDAVIASMIGGAATGWAGYPLAQAQERRLVEVVHIRREVESRCVQVRATSRLRHRV